LFAGAQRPFEIARTDKNDPPRINPHFVEAGGIEPSRFRIEDILARDQKRGRRGGSGSQCEGKPGRGGHIGMGRSIDLVQGTALQTAAEHLVDSLNPECNAFGSSFLPLLDWAGHKLPKKRVLFRTDYHVAILFSMLGDVKNGS
jgi:hypothetical protein